MMDPIAGEYDLILKAPADVFSSRPNVTIKFSLKDRENGTKYVDSAYASLDDRTIDQSGKTIVLKEYTMEDKTANIYYTPTKKIAALSVINNNGTETKGLDELLDVIKLVDDPEVKAVLDILSFYFIAIQSGVATCDIVVNLMKNASEETEPDDLN